MHSFFVVQTPDGYKTFINLACVADATYGPGNDAPDLIKSQVDPAQNYFAIFMRQIIGESRIQNVFWWQGMAADIVQADFQKAVRVREPLFTVLLPAEE